MSPRNHGGADAGSASRAPEGRVVRVLRRLRAAFRWPKARRSAPVESAAPYAPPASPARHLGPKFFAPVEVRARDRAPAVTGELESLGASTPAAYKWHHYLGRYEAILAPYRGRPVRLLEIGVHKGGSLKLWSAYLTPGSVVVGIDLESSCRAFDDPPSRVFVRIGDQTDASFLKDVVAEFGPFDVVIDDGSHRNSHTIASFNHLFLDGLASPATYVVEDTHAGFWAFYRDHAYSFIDLAKDLVDVMHWHYFGRSSAEFVLQNPDRALTASVPRLAAEIESIRFVDSMVVIDRRTREFLPFHELM